MLDAEDLEQLAFAHGAVRSSNQLSAFSTAVALFGNMHQFAVDAKLEASLVPFTMDLAFCLGDVTFT